MATNKKRSGFPWMAPTVTLALTRQNELTCLTLRATQPGDDDEQVYRTDSEDELADLWAALVLDGRPVFAYAISLPIPGKEAWTDADIRNKGKDGTGNYPLAYSSKLLKTITPQGFWVGAGKTPWGQTVPKLNVFREAQAKRASAIAGAPAVKRRSFSELREADAEAAGKAQGAVERPITPRRTR